MPVPFPDSSFAIVLFSVPAVDRRQFDSNENLRLEGPVVDMKSLSFLHP